MILDTIYGYMFPECKKQEDKMSGSGSTGDGNIFGVAMTGFTSDTYTTASTIYPTATQMYNAQNAYGAIGLSSQYQSGYQTGLGAANAGGQYYGQAVPLSPSYNAPPPPTRMLVNIGFVDAAGTAQMITVDAAHAQLMQEISRYNQMTYGCRPTSIAQPHMLDGDFSEDEMTEAEQIISEMDSKSEAGQAARL